VDGLRAWYAFTDFPHFVEVYVRCSSCVKTAQDIELIAREFLQGQAAQNILHSEVTYTADTIRKLHGIPYDAQLAAINRARDWAERELGVTMALIVDIAREVEPRRGRAVADWVIANHNAAHGVAALGLGGYEVGHPPEKFAAEFARANAAGVPCILHAGETMGPESIWSALRVANSRRIGHGVRCIEDPALVAHLRQQQIPLEVCPGSNVCLGVYPSLAAHSLPQLLSQGLYITLNSDDPPMFGTTLTDEFLRCAEAYDWSAETVQTLCRNAARASLAGEHRTAVLVAAMDSV
jgi:adenosine deaminase